MSLKDQLSADMDVFFDLDDFAETVLYKSRIGPQISTRAIVEFAEDLQEDTRGSHRNAKIHLIRSEIPEVNYDDMVEIDGEDWRVIRVLSRDKDVQVVQIRSGLRGDYR